MLYGSILNSDLISINLHPLLSSVADRDLMLIWLIFGGGSGYIAGKITWGRRGTFWLGFFLGLTLLWMGILVAAFLPENENMRINPDDYDEVIVDENGDMYVDGRRCGNVDVRMHREWMYDEYEDFQPETGYYKKKGKKDD